MRSPLFPLWYSIAAAGALPHERRRSFGGSDVTHRPVALVTGGGGGLGRAVGAALVADGWDVALVGRTESSLLEARDALQALAGRVETFVADVSRRPEVEAALAAARERLAAPTAVVNAAGAAASAALLPPDDALWTRMFAVNATGAWHVSTAVLPGMIEAGGGAIVNVASTAGLRGYRYAAAYVASKHALVGLTRAMSEEMTGKGIRVNAVCPGFLDTPMTDASVAAIVRKTGRSAAEARASLAALNASGRLIPPAEVAALVLALVADPARTGESIVIE